MNRVNLLNRLELDDDEPLEDDVKSKTAAYREFTVRQCYAALRLHGLVDLNGASNDPFC